MLEVNLVGPFRLTKALAGAMVLRGAGWWCTSPRTRRSPPTRAGARTACRRPRWITSARIWAAELEGTGVRFLTVDPGEMDTRMHADAMPDADPSTLARPEDVAARLVALVAPAAATRPAPAWRPLAWRSRAEAA